VGGIVRTLAAMPISLNKSDARQMLCAILVPSAGNNAPAITAELVAAAHGEGVHGLLWPMLQAGAGQELPEALMREHRAWVLRMRHATAQILDALGQAGIPAICLRGQAVASLYGARAALRPQSDIDLLVAEDRLMDAKQVAWDLGFRPDELYRHHFSRGDVQIDFHFEPLGIERIRAWAYLTPLRTSDFLQAATPGEVAGVPAQVLPARVLLPYLAFHAMKHSFERLIWLCDIAELTKEIDRQALWPEVERSIREFGLQRPCYFALAYVREHLGGVVPEDVLEGIRPSMGWVEQRLFARHMHHEAIPFLAERIFARMMPDWRHRLAFWRETIYPRYEVRRQIAEAGCVRCHFMRKRLRLLLRAAARMFSESWRMLTAQR
jgi:Uncharacterised nucleotidyltransferase